MSWLPAGLLREAVSVKQAEVESVESLIRDRPDHPLNLRLAFFAQRTSYRLSRALRRSDGSLAIVAVVKRFQPMPYGDSPAVVAPLEYIDEDVRFLEVSGADAAFIQTDSMRYGVEVGEVSKVAKHLRTSTADLGMPISRQDLIVHPLQIAEACEVGAVAVTLVAGACLPDLMELMNSATAMGLEAVVECHTELERDFAIECGATILYLTNFDRTTNTMHPCTAEKLAKDIPSWIITIGGGGLVTASDTWKLLDHGFNAVALGKTLLTSRRTQQFIEEIRSQKSMMGDAFAGNFGTPFSEDLDDS